MIPFETNVMGCFEDLRLPFGEIDARYDGSRDKFTNLQACRHNFIDHLPELRC